MRKKIIAAVSSIATILNNPPILAVAAAVAGAVAGGATIDLEELDDHDAFAAAETGLGNVTSSAFVKPIGVDSNNPTPLDDYDTCMKERFGEIGWN